MAKIVEIPEYRNRIHIFNDRFHSGALLANKLKKYKGKEVSLLAIPAGGVPLALKISEVLGIPFDLVITRKIHIPWNKEAGFGAVSWDGIVLLNKTLVASLGLTKEDIDRCISEEKEVISERLKRFRDDKPFPKLKNKTVIIVDDGLASGFSMLVTIKSIRRKAVKEIVVAVQTAPTSALELIKPYVDEIICLNIRSGPFFAVADAYKAWRDLDDAEVVEILKRAELLNTKKV
jgi:predicted phosphoribosyltransferase